MTVGHGEAPQVPKPEELKQLLAVADKYRLLVDGARDALWDWDLETGEASWSPRLLEILNLPPGALEPTLDSFRSRLHPEDQARFERDFSARIHHALPFELEFRARRDDGYHATLLMRGAVQRDREGTPLRIAGSITDITHRKTIEAALREGEGRFRAIVENCTEGISIIDVEGDPETGHRFRYRYTNPILAARTGMDLTGQTPEDGLPPAMAAASLRDFERIVREHITIRGEYEGEFPAGPRRLFVTLMPFENDAGRVTQILAFVNDITEQVTLQRRIVNRQKAESLGLLAGAIAHDFNNLLVGVMGNLGLALEEIPADSPIRQYLHDAIKTSQRAASLTRQMLAYSGRGAFEMISFDINRQIIEMDALLRTIVPRTIDLDVSVAPDSLPIRGDSQQLQQVIIDLVTNAVEAIGDHEGRISVATRALQCTAEDLKQSLFDFGAMPGSYIALDVQDTGPGIDEATLCRIFDPFFSTKAQSRGLGLSAVQGIVRGHQGAIQVASEIGRGTRFRILIPKSDVAVQAPLTPRPTPDTPVPTTGTILVVDDEAIVTRLAELVLKRQGFTVIVAPGGREALAVLETHRADIRLVLLDLSMPGMSGEEAFERMRRLDRRVPVVLMTGYSEREFARRATEIGFAGFLQKPFTPEELKRRVREGLAGR